MSEKVCIVRYNGKDLVYGIPTDFCHWRVKTLLTKEPETIRWIQSFNPGDIFYDVGANIGLYSIFASSVVGCKTYAFEPEAANFALLNRNIYFNKLSELVTAYSIGISDTTQVDVLSLSKPEVGGSGHTLGLKKDAFKQGCVSMSIDDLVKRGLPRPNHIKVDIDGLEPLVIQGASDTIKIIDSLLIELDLKNFRHKLIIEYFLDNGFVFDQDQVDRTARPAGNYFENYREYIFKRT